MEKNTTKVEKKPPECMVQESHVARNLFEYVCTTPMKQVKSKKATKHMFQKSENGLDTCSKKFDKIDDLHVSKR